MGHFDKKYEVDIKKSFPKFPYPKSFQRIQEVLDDQALVDHYLLQLDHQIAEAVQRNRVEGYSVAQALYDILRDTEDREGFNKNEVKYVLGVLSTEEFYGMMEGPYAFLDPFVTPRHGAETHRIQWWIIAQDLHAQPARYEAGVNAGKLFSSTAAKDAYADKENNVWYLTLDALQGKCTTARAPESLKDYILSKPEYRNIAAAEAAQMKWDTAVKLRDHKRQELGKAKALMEKNFELKKYGKSS